MLRIGVPEYRLPRRILTAEIGAILALGVEVRTGVEVGRDLHLAELTASGEPVVLATGTPLPQIPDLPGADLEGVRGGVDFLRAVALGEEFPLGDRVLVIGGGNVALDAARSALRLLRARGRGEVTIAYRRTRQESPAYKTLQGRDEIEETVEEGVAYRERLWPVEVRGRGGRVQAMAFTEKGADGPEREEVLEATDVLFAIGQRPDLPAAAGPLAPDPKGYLAHDPESYRVEGTDAVYVIGDAAYGPGLIIEAVAAGKRAALDIYRETLGRDLEVQSRARNVVLRAPHLEEGFDRLSRESPGRIDPAARVRESTRPVETPYAEGPAAGQALRCLECSVNTIFDSERCILCGGCVDVCPEDCLRIVPLEDVELPELPAETGEDVRVILKDEERCIRCGMCYRRCPVDAITMEQFQPLEEIHERRAT